MRTIEGKAIVYLTVNLANHKIYIGVHKVENFDVQDTYIGCGIYTNKPSSVYRFKYPFHRAVQKYGFESFRRRTLFECDTYDEALHIESKIVNENFVKSRYTYNAVVGGGVIPDCRVKCYQYDLDGNFICEFDSIKLAAQTVGLKYASSISDAIVYGSVSKGYLWSNQKVDKLDTSKFKISTYNNYKNPVYAYYEDGTFDKEFESKLKAAEYYGINRVSEISCAIKCFQQRKERYFSDVFVRRFVKPNTIKHFNNSVYQYTLNGEFVQKWNNIKSVGIAFGIKNAKKLAATIATRNTYKGFQWSWIKTDRMPDKSVVGGRARRVGRFDLEGNLLEEYSSVAKCRENYSNVGKVLTGKARHCKGFIFKYL